MPTLSSLFFLWSTMVPVIDTTWLQAFEGKRTRSPGLRVACHSCSFLRIHDGARSTSSGGGPPLVFASLAGAPAPAPPARSRSNLRVVLGLTLQRGKICASGCPVAATSKSSLAAPLPCCRPSAISLLMHVVHPLPLFETSGRRDSNVDRPVRCLRWCGRWNRPEFGLSTPTKAVSSAFQPQPMPTKIALSTPGRGRRQSSRRDQCRACRARGTSSWFARRRLWRNPVLQSRGHRHAALQPTGWRNRARGPALVGVAGGWQSEYCRAGSPDRRRSRAQGAS